MRCDAEGIEDVRETCSKLAEIVATGRDTLRLAPILEDLSRSAGDPHPTDSDPKREEPITFVSRV